MIENYSIGAIDPMAAYLQGAQGIQTLQNNNQVMQQRQAAADLARQQQEAAQAAAAQKQADQAALFEGKYSPAAVAAYTAKHPDDFQAVKFGYDALDNQQKADKLGFATQIESAYMANRPDLVQKQLDDRVIALRNSGAPEQEINAMQTFADLNKVNPRHTVTTITAAAAAADPQKYFEARKSMIEGVKTGVETTNLQNEEQRKEQLQPYAVQQAGANVEKTNAETYNLLQQRGLTDAQIAKTQAEAEKQLQDVQQGGSGKAPTEGQAKANLFGTRAQKANFNLTMLELDPSNVPHVPDKLLGAANFLPTMLGGLSEKQQSYLQSKRDFITSVLRKESGAVIGADEFDSADKQYFPQYGDGQKIIAQKAANRANEANLILAEAGSFAGKGVSPSAATGGKTASKADIVAAAKAHGVNPVVALKGWTDAGNTFK